MNKRDKDILLQLASYQYKNQRDLADTCDCSLGAVNASLKNLLKADLIQKNMNITSKSEKMLKASSPERAVILADDFGVHILPEYTNKPKALLEVDGLPLIEHIILNLLKARVSEIYIVVGFCKEKLEYLIDKYSVELIVNPYYAKTGSLHSLALAKQKLKNCYVVPANILFKENPFRIHELYSWYMVSDENSDNSFMRVNRKLELVSVLGKESGNTMLGMGYFTEELADILSDKLEKMTLNRNYELVSWEKVLLDGDKLIVSPMVFPFQNVSIINSVEDLYELQHQKSDIVGKISAALSVEKNVITDVSVLKKGAVNVSLYFRIGKEKYVARIPDLKREKLVLYGNEAAVYEALKGLDLSEEVVFIDSSSGFKISKYIENTRTPDPKDPSDIKLCMKVLREFHEKKIQVSGELDVFEAIEFFESEWNGRQSVYADYKKTKENVFSLRSFIEKQKREKTLTHIDAVWENFLIGGDKVRLIDWEYAAMQDPHMDIAMYGIYALYDRQQMDYLISAYFPEGCSNSVRVKIYCYIAVAGLLWSNWCEYKYKSGTEFGEYSLRQYRYAKDYYRIAKELIEQMED